MTTIIALTIALTGVLLMSSLPSLMIYGKPISEKTLDIFFRMSLLKYKLNKFNTSMFYGFNLPYISSISFCIFAKWYVDDYGTIPRWSKWHKIINERHAELMKGRKGHNLENL